MAIKIGSGLVPFSKVSDRFLPSGYREGLSFKSQLLAASKVKGLNGVGLDYPLQFEDPIKMKKKLNSLDLKLCTLEIGIYGKREWRMGAFTAPDRTARCRAIDVVKKGIDAAFVLGVEDILLWLGQDGFDYPFQVNYTSNWDYLIDGIREVGEYRKDIKISVEYKLKEPRLRCHISTVGSALYMVEKVGLPNVGVTIDLGHSLLAQENPAEAVSLLARSKRLFQVHVNDNYCDWDSDLLVGSINLWTTLEFFYWLRKVGYKGWYIMDFYPYREDGIMALTQCIEKTRRLHEFAGRLKETDIEEFQKRHDAVAIYKLLWSEIIR